MALAGAVANGTYPMARTTAAIAPPRHEEVARIVTVLPL
ncbi:MAG: hypothetical protein AVDCRST_MAG70-2407 [uncultured Thermomicrobiales bacterium]|uniref:Uncharacterized protein n=1 Tax=uncultured Thermomicrobiales bacterium TaxID=1645740 RepID=A0A6J4VC15_9BACT|nr:MAG: hypothetical protein AVDCRST_MAG70-2407 [uncultured Thermomicrobiales bacterium]